MDQDSDLEWAMKEVSGFNDLTSRKEDEVDLIEIKKKLGL